MHNKVRSNVQLRNADPRWSDSARLAPLKSHSLNTARSVRNRLRSSSRKSLPENSQSTQCGKAGQLAARVSSAYSLTAISASVADLRSLASTVITGMCRDSVSASRTASTG